MSRSAAVSSGSARAMSATVCVPEASTEPIAPHCSRELLDRLLQGVGLLVERVFGLLEVVDGRVRPAGHDLGDVLSLLGVGCPGVLHAFDHRLGGLDGPLEPLSDEPRASLRRLRLRLLRARAGRRRRADVLDDRLELTAPDGHGAAHALGPFAGRDGLVAVVVSEQRCDADEPRRGRPRRRRSRRVALDPS